MKTMLISFVLGACVLALQPAYAEEAAPLLEKSNMCRSALFAVAGYLNKEKLSPELIEDVYLGGKEAPENLKPYLENAEKSCESTGQPMVNMITLAFVLMNP